MGESKSARGVTELWLFGGRLCLSMSADGKGELLFVPIDRSGALPRHARERKVSTPLDLAALRALGAIVAELLAFRREAQPGQVLALAVTPGGNRERTVWPKAGRCEGGAPSR
jgi:hypothetical protein